MMLRNAMKYVEMKKVLKELNRKWGLDFVSATSGDCCNTCGDMRTGKETEAWENAETFLVIKWFFKGMNYNGKFDEQEKLFIKYHLSDKVTLEDACEDLRKALEGRYTVTTPIDKTRCIELDLVK